MPGRKLTIGCLFFLWALWPVFPVLAKMPDDPEVKQLAYQDIKVYEAWNYFTGSRKAVVAIIDNGFDTYHPDLLANVWQNEGELPRNGLDDDQNGYIDDVNGWNFFENNNDPRPKVDKMNEWEKADGVFNHATLVAGLIGAVGDNNLGMAGINWRVKLMNLKVIASGGEGDFEFLHRAIRYAVDNGAQIINISLVGTDTAEAHQQVKEAIKYAYKKGVAIFAAAGNNMESLADYSHYPICADAGESEQWIFGVSAIVENHHLAIFSNTGGGCVDITAPGVEVTSTVRYSPTNGLNKLVSGGWRGTSFATPLVSGVAALLKGLNPAWQAKEIYQALTSSTHHTSGQDEVVYARLFGAGLLQADKAVKYVLEKMPRDNHLLVFDKNTGQGAVKNLLTGEETVVEMSVLLGTQPLGVPQDTGDIDGDGENELIRSNGPEVEIYNLSGELKRKFLAFGGDNRLEMELTLLDYDHDGRQDIVVFVKNSDRPIRIWNYKIKKIFEWQLPVKFGVKAEILSY